MKGSALSERLLAGTRRVLSGLLQTVLVLFFLLISGDTFLRRLVEVLPRFKNKWQAGDISNQIEADILAYLVTITMMNEAVGVVTGTAAALTGLGDPLLLGDGRVSAELRADPRTDGRCQHVRAGRIAGY